MPKASKRVPLSRKYNIKKRVAEKERKARRAAKKNPSLRKKLRKDLGIPNLNPFKQQILKKLEEQQRIVKFNELQRQRRQQELVRCPKQRLEPVVAAASLSSSFASPSCYVCLVFPAVAKAKARRR